MDDYKIYSWPSSCILIFCVPCFLIWLKQCAFTFTVTLINKSVSQDSILINMGKNAYSCILIILFTYSNIITSFSSVCCQKISSYWFTTKYSSRKSEYSSQRREKVIQRRPRKLKVFQWLSGFYNNWVYHLILKSHNLQTYPGSPEAITIKLIMSRARSHCQCGQLLSRDYTYKSISCLGGLYFLLVCFCLIQRFF